DPGELADPDGRLERIGDDVVGGGLHGPHECGHDLWLAVGELAAHDDAVERGHFVVAAVVEQSAVVAIDHQLGPGHKLCQGINLLTFDRGCADGRVLIHRAHRVLVYS